MLHVALSSLLVKQRLASKRCSAPGPSPMSAGAIVAFGPTQAGKSTMLGKLKTSDEVAPIVGDGSGESVTEHPALLQTQLGLMLDCPGCNDSRLHFTNEEAARRVAVAIIASEAREVKFLVFESLANDSLSLRGTLANLTVAFGPKAMAGVIVLATKADALSDRVRERKLELIRKVMTVHGLHELIEWSSLWDHEGDNSRQLNRLRDAIARVPRVPVDALEDLVSRQEKRAKELFDCQIPTEAEETYIDYEIFQEEYDDVEEYQGIDSRPHVIRKRRGGVAGLLGGMKSVVEDRPVEVTKTRKVKKTRPAKRSVERTRMRKHFQTIDHFMTPALTQIIEDERKALAMNEKGSTFIDATCHMVQASVASEAMYHADSSEALMQYVRDISQGFSGQQNSLFTTVVFTMYGDVACGEFISEEENTMYMAFRGTTLNKGIINGVKDLITDISVSKAGQYDFDQMHSGFRQRAEAVPLEIQERLRMFIERGGRVVLTGHSLGAATAGCLACMMLDRFSGQDSRWFHRLACIGFGSPLFLSEDARFRVSQNNWAQCFSFVVNAISDMDEVVKLPLSLTQHVGGFDWQPFGVYYFLQRAVNGTSPVTLKQMGTCSRDELNVLIREFRGPTSMTAHKMVGYRKGCSDACRPARLSLQSML